MSIRPVWIIGMIIAASLTPAFALTITQSQTYSFSGSGSFNSVSDTDSFTFQLFSPSLGTLTAVELTATGSGDVTNRQDYTSISQFTHVIGLSTSFDAGPLRASSSGTATSGVVPIVVMGAPIFYTDNIPFTATASTTLDALLAQFVGVGSATSPISVTASGNHQLAGAVSFVATANVSLTYTYTPVDAPAGVPDEGATLPLAGLVLGGLLVSSRRFRATLP